MNISLESLQDLRHDDTGEGEGFDFLNHSPQFNARAAGRGAEEINPYGSVDQDQARVRRIRLRSPFQIPRP